MTKWLSHWQRKGNYPLSTVHKALKNKTGHSTVAVTVDGRPAGKLLGIVTGRDYRISRITEDMKAKDYNSHKKSENDLTDSSKRYMSGAGNVVDRDGFRFPDEAADDFVKVGIGGGTR